MCSIDCGIESNYFHANESHHFEKTYTTMNYVLINTRTRLITTCFERLDRESVFFVFRDNC